MLFSNILIHWYLQNKRDLPWRKTNNVYHIWLSEIILQQTRVNQGLKYYEDFVKDFPSVSDLAKAKEDTVLKLWQGLGYYSRARNMHFSAKYIVRELEGKFPQNYKDLIKLKGVGDYTASAIASICYDEPTAVVDGNVYRVLSRYFGIKTPINSTKGIKEFKELAQHLIDQKRPGLFNQSIMEFGAVQCKPKNPNCNICPLNESCAALQKQLVNSLPVKQNKIVIRNRYLNYLVITNHQDVTILKQRRDKGIWQGLYEFPLIESQSEIHIKELLKNYTFPHSIIDDNFTITLFNQNQILHKLTHQHLYVKFWIINTKQILEDSVSWQDFEKYPVPILLHNFAENFKSKT